MYLEFRKNLSYKAADQKQKALLNQKKEGILGFELNHCITTGIRDHNPDINSRCDIYEVVHTDRGGLTTMHQPGQLVVFPVVNLRKHGLFVKDYVELLLQVSQRTFERYNVQTAKTDSPGLWTFNGKIMFVGVRISNGYTQHGVALNVCNEVLDFSKINSCGLTSQKYASIETLTGKVVPCAEVFNVFCEEFLLTLNLKSLINKETKKSSLGAVGSAFP